MTGLWFRRKKQTHLICFGFRPIYEEFFIGTATFVNHRPITVKSRLPWSRVKTSVFSFFILFMDMKIRQTVQEKVDYCRCAQVNVIQKVRSVFRVKNILVRKGNWMWRSLYINIYLPQDIKPAPCNSPAWTNLLVPCSNLRRLWMFFLNK